MTPKENVKRLLNEACELLDSFDVAYSKSQPTQLQTILVAILLHELESKENKSIAYEYQLGTPTGDHGC